MKKARKKSTMRSEKKSDKKAHLENREYDAIEVSRVIDGQRSLKFENLGLRLPEIQPTQVLSIRVPTELLNQIRAISSQKDVPYQGLIKLYLAEAVERAKNKKKAV
jgi:hypothetical protein